MRENHLSLVGEQLWGPGGHPLTYKFRRIMIRISNFANDMDYNIKNLCQNLRKELEAKREENESEIENLKDAIRGYGIDPGPFPYWENEQYDQEMDLYVKKEKQQRDELDDDDRNQVEIFEEQLEELEGETDYLHNELEDLVENYPQIQFQSLFFAVYSYFEKYLNDLCNSIHESESLPAKPKDYYGKGIDRSQAYLKKAALLKFPDNTTEWQVIKALNEIRNDLIHSYDYNRPQDELPKKLRILLDYFWLDDPFWQDEFWIDFDVTQYPSMFSLDFMLDLEGNTLKFFTKQKGGCTNEKK